MKFCLVWQTLVKFDRHFRIVEKNVDFQGRQGCYCWFLPDDDYDRVFGGETPGQGFVVAGRKLLYHFFTVRFGVPNQTLKNRLFG